MKIIILELCINLIVSMATQENVLGSKEQDAIVEILSEEESAGTPPTQNEIEGYDPSIDPYPEHEPIMQPFDENYEEEQAAEKKRLEKKAKRKLNKESGEKLDEYEYELNDFETLYEDEFKSPEIQFDGMADHEPVYQPEDPGDEAVNYPFHQEEMGKDPQINKNTKRVVEKPVYDDIGEREIEDEHEPMYQPEDPGESHDEL